jgi:uncharacterized membrane protein YgcG
MWDQAKQHQFDELRRSELAGTLTAEERSTLDHLLHELDENESCEIAVASYGPRTHYYTRC